MTPSRTIDAIVDQLATLRSSGWSLIHADDQLDDDTTLAAAIASLFPARGRVELAEPHATMRQGLRICHDLWQSGFETAGFLDADASGKAIGNYLQDFLTSSQPALSLAKTEADDRPSMEF